jgi:hypothetical protein
MCGSPIPEISALSVPAYLHDDGRLCYLCRYWVGNARDGHWEQGYWYQDDEQWRYCGPHHN